MALAVGSGAPAIAGLPVDLERIDDGRPVTIAAGPHALHLVFFATWCPPCVEQLPALAELESRYGASSYRLILVAVPSRQEPARLLEFVRDAHPPGAVLFDRSGAAQRALGVERLPAHVLIDGSGAVVHRAVAVDDGLEAAIEAVVDAGSRR
jgi:thiol-disulfide isomerase/thioredoxin